jgi:hypothetical protein
MTIAQILELSPGSKGNNVWINGDFEAIVSDAQPAKGKGPATAFLSDPHNPSVSILGNFFGTDTARFNGKICHFSGKGITRTEFKGVQQVTLGDKATIQVVGVAGTPAKPAASQGTSSPAPAGNAPVFGATVGMAINQASELIRASTDNLELSYLTSPAFSKDLYTLASDIIRITRVLEAGKLAPSAKDRADPEAAARALAEKALAEHAAAAKAEAERKAKEDQAKKEANQTGPGTEIPEEDVPF